jgi:hypothetical protein
MVGGCGKVRAVSMQAIGLGAPRGPADGGRRYRPVKVDFDTRNVNLDLEIQEDWDVEIKAMWQENKAKIRANLLSELGCADGERKLENYREMGPAPWSVVFEHTALLRQVRGSFAHGDFYPALVSACALGERLLNQLVLELRSDYSNHRATTKRVRRGRPISDWGSLIGVLHDWGVLDEETGDTYRQLEQLRHTAIHYDPSLSAGGRDPALAALRALQQIVERVFEPHGGPPRFIADTVGSSYIALEAENEPLVRRVFLPHCALVSPVHRFEWQGALRDEWAIYDDSDYPGAPLTDEEFAERLRAIEGQTPTES